MTSLASMHDDGDALAQSIRTMRSSLETHQKSTGDILNILVKVDTRLSSLEAHMAPIRRVTEQLTLAEKNVIRSYDSMIKIHDNFRVVGEADAVLRKGLAPPATHPPTTTTTKESLLLADEDMHNLAAYIEVVDRVQAAMAFLRRNIRMRSAEVTLRQLELKQAKLLADLREEIHRLLSSGSQCLIQFTAPLGPLPTLSTRPPSSSSSLYQAADPISLTLARRVKVMCESMLRAGDPRWMDAYIKARRSKIETTLKAFLDRQNKLLLAGEGGGGGGGGGARGSVAVMSMNEGEGQLPPLSPSRASGGGMTTPERGSVMVGGVGGGGGGGGGVDGEWIQYVHFARELCKAEELVFARALPANMPQSVTAVVDVLTPALARLTSEANEALDRMLAKERSRGEKVILLLALLKGTKAELPAFEKTLRPLGTSTGSTHTSTAMQFPSSSASLRHTPMAHPPSSSTAASSSSSSTPLSPLDQIRKLYHHLGRLTIQALAGLADDVLGDSCSSRNLPSNATVHVITSNTLRSFKRIMVYDDIFEELANVGGAGGLLPLLPWETEDDRAAIMSEDNDEGGEGEETHLRVYANHLFLSLLKNLRSKADAYAKMEGGLDAYSAAGRPHLFLMNNAHYMITTIRGSSSATTSSSSSSSSKAPTTTTTANSSTSNAGAAISIKRVPSASLASALSEAFLDRLVAVTNDSRGKFTVAVWGALAEQVSEKGLPALEYVKGSTPPQLTFESGRLIKARFTAFNAALDEIYTHQKLFSVPDGGLRGRLREEAKASLLPGYTVFFEKFAGTQFSKKHMEQYLRFPPPTVGSMVEELYVG